MNHPLDAWPHTYRVKEWDGALSYALQRQIAKSNLLGIEPLDLTMAV